MSRRLVYVAFGAAVGVLVVRRAGAAARRYTPAGVQERLAGSLGGLPETVREFLDDVRAGMAEREDELRRELGLDGRHDQVDSDPAWRPDPGYRSGGPGPDSGAASAAGAPSDATAR